MTTVDQGPASGGLVSRAKNIILSPKTEWDRIDGEAATVPGLYTGYICILAAIPAIASIIGGLLFGLSLLGVAGPVFIVPAIATAVVGYVLGLIGVFVVALVADALAPSFGGTKSQIQALKAVGYAMTAAWVGGVLNIIPFLGWLGALAGGLYSLYLLYLGLPKLMKTPEDKGLVFTIVVIVVAAVVQWAVLAVVGSVVALAGLSTMAAGAGAAAALYH
jgi:hypothetical protein